MVEKNDPWKLNKRRTPRKEYAKYGLRLTIFNPFLRKNFKTEVFFVTPRERTNAVRSYKQNPDVKKIESI